MSRQASSGVPMKALKFVGLILLLAAIAACFGLLAKEPADTGRLAHYGLRLLLIALCLTGWFWTQAMISARSVSNDAVLFDGLHELTAPLNAYLNVQPRLANGLLIVTSAFIDLLGLFLIIWSVLGPSMRPFGALLLLFLFRQACQASCALPIPRGMIFRRPGFPSLLVTYDVANDFFFSGHTAIAALGAIELAQISPWLGLAGALIALVEGATVIILRAHYTMDVLAAIAASWCAFSLSVWLQGLG